MKRIIGKLPDMEYYLQKYPLTQQLQQRKAYYDKVIKDNLVDKSRFVVVVGPCSAGDYDSMEEYLLKLKELSDRVEDKILIVARVYTAKPRTDGGGYLGLLFNENEHQSVDIAKGIAHCRRIMIRCVEIGLPVADELLYPFVLPYLQDLVSYYFIGARSSLDPLHRDFASSLDVAVGVKNAIDGDLIALAKSLVAVSNGKTFVNDNMLISSSGNKHCHAVLRGSHNGQGFVANFDKNSCKQIVSLYKQYDIANGFVMIDCSHANSGKIANNQVEVATVVTKDENVHGITLESYLFCGTAIDQYGVSKTDECLDFVTTDKLIIDIYRSLSNK